MVRTMSDDVSRIPEKKALPRATIKIREKKRPSDLRILIKLFLNNNITSLFPLLILDAHLK